MSNTENKSIADVLQGVIQEKIPTMWDFCSLLEEALPLPCKRKYTIQNCMIIEDKGLFFPKMAIKNKLKMLKFDFLAPEKARNSKLQFLSNATKIQIKIKTELYACKAC